MKTKARIETVNRYGYNILIWSIFEPNEDLRTARIIGRIEFQEFEGKFNSPKFVIETDRIKYIESMLKLAKLINSISDYSTEAKEIKNRINFEEVRLFDDEFISIKDHGKNLYNTIKENGEIYGVIIAASDREAAKIAAKNT